MNVESYLQLGPAKRGGRSSTRSGSCPDPARKRSAEAEGENSASCSYKMTCCAVVYRLRQRRKLGGEGE